MLIFVCVYPILYAQKNAVYDFSLLWFKSQLVAVWTVGVAAPQQLFRGIWLSYVIS